MSIGAKLITHVETQQPVAALTFDDGPHPIYTPQVQHVLEKYGARGTFFVVGQSASRYPEILKDIVKGGHVIGNHSWSHPYLPHLNSRLDRLRQIWNCSKATTPYCTRLFRPPYGAQNAHIRFDARLLMYHQIILWSGSAQDWIPQHPSEIGQKIIERIKPGSIFLLHDAIFVDHGVPDTVSDRAAMIEGLEHAISVLKDQIRFVTVPELLRTGRPVCKWPISASQ